MEPVIRPRVKICCMGSVEEARLAIRHGAAALGLVSAMPSGPGVIAEELIAAIAATVPPGVSSFLLTSSQDTDAIVEQQRRCRVDTLQLVDRLERGEYRDLRDALPGVKLVQVIHIGQGDGEEAIEEAMQAAPFVNALLLDSGNRSLPIKELGGTGRVHDWAISRHIREVVAVPVYLAGGLNVGNVADAIRLVGPFGVDVCSGVRTDGLLDEDKLRRFFAAVDRASPR